MSRAWVLALLTGAVTMGLKGAGAIIGGSQSARHQTAAFIDQITPILLPTVLTALIVVQVFSTGRHLTFDARVAGLVAAVTLARTRAQPVIVLVAAAAATALVRLVQAS